MKTHGLWNSDCGTFRYNQQYRFSVLYKTVKVGDYFPD